MITHGTIAFSLPAAFAENRPGATVTLNYAIPEGMTWDAATTLTHQVGDLARAEALRLQAGKSAPSVVSPGAARVPASDAVSPTPAKRNPAEVTIGAKNNGPPGSSDTPDTSTTASSQPPGLSSALSSVPPVDATVTATPPTAMPAVIGDGPPTVAPAVTGPATDASAPPANGAAEVSDADLGKAVAHKSVVLTPVYGETTMTRICEVISRHLGGAAVPPGRAGQIPQHARQAFLTDLGALA